MLEGLLAVATANNKELRTGNYELLFLSQIRVPPDE